MRSERLRHVADIRISNVDKKSVEGQVPVRLCNYTDVYYNERITTALEFMESTATPEQCIAFQLAPGDVLLTKDSETPDDIGVTAVVTEAMPHLLCGYHLAMIRPRLGVDGRYLRFALASSPARSDLGSRANGITRFGLRSSVIGDVSVPLPTLDRQRAIADYLDRETARLDALIERKQRLIGLLNESFKSYRTKGVLGDLDPISGRGTAHPGWQTMSFGVLIRLHRGLDLPDDRREAGSIPVISSGGISGYHSRTDLKGPGVVTGRYGTVGEVFYAEGPYWPLNTTLYVSDYRGNEPRWVYHLLSCLPLEVDSSKSAVTGINRNAVAFLRVPKPPIEEQRSIAQALDSAAREISALRSKIEGQITLLSERRQALITAAVNGQIPIPGAA